MQWLHQSSFMHQCLKPRKLFAKHHSTRRKLFFPCRYWGKPRKLFFPCGYWGKPRFGLAYKGKRAYALSPDQPSKHLYDLLLTFLFFYKVKKMKKGSILDQLLKNLCSNSTKRTFKRIIREHAMKLAILSFTDVPIRYFSFKNSSIASSSCSILPAVEFLPEPMKTAIYHE